eukprot:CAMPEP_0171088722 /NCGR_PEP_ID=MMETSP0766_2-20121228/20951_1 /TAXON_ID=439317 /ORGANISM="Gambierdiscus australes, Strain CAWD 149" /LENGTH=105 /DNA_ID=CAMNT_0011546535 /DNA_START=174 /DNA_END=491 /DNA_ORIENTATION=-
MRWRAVAALTALNPAQYRLKTARTIIAPRQAAICLFSSTFRGMPLDTFSTTWAAACVVAGRAGALHQRAASRTGTVQAPNPPWRGGAGGGAAWGPMQLESPREGR